MIPQHWRPHFRDHDDELVGYLVPGSAAGTIVPATLFGYPLAPAGDGSDAATLLEERGLAVLADRWTLQRPGADPLSVSIVEVTPDRVVVQGVDYGAIDANVHRVVLPNPVPDGALVLG